MSSIRYVGAAFLMAAAIACGEGPMTAPAEVPSLRMNDERGPNAKASGHVEVNLFGYFDTYTFEAMSKGGEVTGTFQWRSAQPNGAVTTGSGRVICLTVIGNVAHLAGELQPDDVAWAPPPFNHVIWTVVDNDGGPGDAPDLASLMIAPKTRAQAEAHCEAGNLALAPLDRGDVKVRGGEHVNGVGVANEE
jgi:hypothetical protein